MPYRSVKRSIKIRGHLTSISIEDAFWWHFRRIALQRDQRINTLASAIAMGKPSGARLSSAIRMFVLSDLEARAFPLGLASAGKLPTWKPPAPKAIDADAALILNDRARVSP